MVGRINNDVVGLNWNLSVSEEDTIKTCWDNDVDLEVIPR
jgi:hypothetical protein